MRVLAAFTFAVLLVACGADETWDTHTLVDDGDVCLGTEWWSNGQQEIDLIADATITFQVVALHCFSSSCTRNQETSCEVTLQGDMLTITSSSQWETASSEGQTCTSDCGLLAATCQSPSVPGGTYTISHGARSLAIDVPSTVPSCPDELGR